MKKKLISLGMFGVVLTAAGMAVGGAAKHGEVEVYSDSARGTVVGARDSKDKVQEISCATRAVGVSTYGFCYAKSAAGATLTCTTTIEEQLQVMRSVGPASHIFFHIASDGSSCYNVQVNSGSPYLR